MRENVSLRRSKENRRKLSDGQDGLDFLQNVSHVDKNNSEYFSKLHFVLCAPLVHIPLFHLFNGTESVAQIASTVQFAGI
jgi:hypothetical protein